MATLDDILTTQKNGVVAVNNLSQALNSFYNSYVYLSGENTSGTVTSTTAQTIATGSGRFVSYTTVASGGSTTGLVYDSVSYATVTTAGDGVTATVKYSGVANFVVGDRISVVNVVPSGYNTTSATITAVNPTSSTVTYANATTGSMTTAGILFKIFDFTTQRSLLLSSLSGTEIGRAHV